MLRSHKALQSKIMSFTDKLNRWPRFKHAYSLGAGWWAVLVGAWTLLSSADTLIGKLGTTDFKAKWDALWLLPTWGWRTWLLGICVITVIVIFERSYRLAHTLKRQHKNELADALVKKDNAFSQMVVEKDEDFSAMVRMKDGDFAAAMHNKTAELEIKNVELGRKDGEIERLTQEPDIAGRVLAVFWDFWRDDHGKCHVTDSCFFVRLELVNKNDVPCTIQRYWMIFKAGDCGSQGRNVLGSPNVDGVLEHHSIYGDSDTVVDDMGTKKTQLSSIRVHSGNPLTRGCAQDGWVSFHVMECVPPIVDGDLPPHWVADVSIVVEDHIGGSGHPHTIAAASMAIFPAERKEE